jgi:ABC-type Fe3+-siderophore transport system permease subunit
MRTANTVSWLIAVAGVWEVIAPFVLGYSDNQTALWNAIIVGVVLVILGAGAALTTEPNTERGLNGVSAVAGVWLVLAPFILGYSVIQAALWNAIIVGIIVIVLGVAAALSLGRTAAQ